MDPRTPSLSPPRAYPDIDVVLRSPAAEKYADEQLRRFEAIVRSDPDLMRLLGVIQGIRLPQWRLVAGCLYQTVWNVLTGRARGTGIKDYDLIYFDDDLSWTAEDAVIRRVAPAARGASVR